MREQVKEDSLLIARISRRVTGAQVHTFNNLLQNYHMAVWLHNANVKDNVADEVLADSLAKVRKWETQLRLFK